MAMIMGHGDKIMAMVVGQDHGSKTHDHGSRRPRSWP